MYKFNGFENALKINSETGYKNIHTPCDMYDVLKDIWCRETCAPRLQNKWSEDNKTLGQCSVTAFLVQDVFGGEVYAVKTENGVHCYNVVDGLYFDLTSEQFGNLAADLNYSEMIPQSRSDDHHFKKEEKLNRYLLLKKEFEKRTG